MGFAKLQAHRNKSTPDRRGDDATTTGLQMNCGGVISRRSIGEKRFFDNELVFPKFSVINPPHSFTLLTCQIQNGIIDAFVHTIEQCFAYDVNSSLQV